MEVKSVPGKIQLATAILAIILIIAFLGLIIWLFLTSINNESIDLDSEKKKK